MKVNHNISISSPPDREKLVAEIFWGMINGQKSTKSVKIWKLNSTHGPTEVLGG
jgi:hypothetical protein